MRYPAQDNPGHSVNRK